MCTLHTNARVDEPFLNNGEVLVPGLKINLSVKSEIYLNVSEKNYVMRKDVKVNIRYVYYI